MRYRVAFLMLAVLAMVSATVTVAVADTTETTVYGQATIAPYAIEVSGGGGVSIDSPLLYAGTYDSGPQAEELAHTITITNVGTSTCDLTIAGQMAPTNGSVTWTFGHAGGGGWVDEAGPNAAVWRFFPQAGKTAGDFGVAGVSSAAVRMSEASQIATGVPGGSSVTYDSTFEFPTSSSGSGSFDMSAIVSAVAQ
jgi:hypothetical protein